MSDTTMVYRGVINGQTIELEQETGLAPGAAVEVTIQPAQPAPMSVEEIRTIIDETFGACADEADEWDEFDKWYREGRRQERRSIEDDE
jgi:hypothetical protein